MARKHGQEDIDSDIEFQKLLNKITELKDSIMEEYDMLELIDDSIKDVFSCDFDCSTCSEKERGTCLHNFKKANLYWIRKVSVEEEQLRKIVEQMDEMKEILSDAIKKAKKYKKIRDEKEYEEHTDTIKEKVKKQQGYGYYI